MIERRERAGCNFRIRNPYFGRQKLAEEKGQEQQHNARNQQGE